mgnify:CR=1 FL=1
MILYIYLIKLCTKINNFLYFLVYKYILFIKVNILQLNNIKLPAILGVERHSKIC